MEILWKRAFSAEFWANHPKLCGKYAFPKNFHTRKLGEVSVLCAVYWNNGMMEMMLNVNTINNE